MSGGLSTEAQQVVDFLLSQESYIVFGLGKLNFTLEGFRVDTEGYREIGHKIRSGAIEVRVIPPDPDRESEVEATYTARMDKLSVPEGLDLRTEARGHIRNQAMIVHEATHALVDYHRATLSGALDEACAYVAGQVYSMSVGSPQTSSERRAQAILSASHAIVQQRRMKYVTGAVLRASDTDVAALVAAVRGHTGAYPDADVVRTGDGIDGGLLNPWYLPRPQPDRD